MNHCFFGKRKREDREEEDRPAKRICRRPDDFCAALPALHNEAERRPLGGQPFRPFLQQKRKRNFSPEVERTLKRRRLYTYQENEAESKGQKQGEKKTLKGRRKTIKAVSKTQEKEACCSNISNNPPTHEQAKCLGFPNLGQTCYMNSCLQSLLTLEDFVDDVHEQSQVWRAHPDAGIMRYLTRLKKAHYSEDVSLKRHLLYKLKKVVSSWAPEFKDNEQKDAHEFLSSLLEQIRGLSSQLQKQAASMGTSYRCPVKKHMVFKIENTRTCKRCGVGSTREEEYTNLSLDLTPGGGTVEDMLQNYLKDTDLEYRCECGGTMSGQRSLFATLPRVLVLHLKRVRYTPSYQLEKVRDPVDIFRDLVISSKEGGHCYSLVSAINHLGTKAGSGHYISEGVDLNVPVTDPTDRWFTYDDMKVTETSGADVCEQRRQNAYILVYKKQS